MVRAKRCKDCLPDTRQRPAPHPGPRCTTHHRIRVAKIKAAKHDAWVRNTYGLEPGEYARLYAFQDGLCYICRRANGKVRKLAVDHDHSCCPGPTSCGECVRGLLCKTCNNMLGHLRDDPEAIYRAMVYLSVPPLQRMREEER